MQSLSLFNEVVTALEQHENSVRIKKLMWCICNQVWENDPNRLNELNVKDLIQDLRQINPTLEDLKASLFKVVKTLNKPAEYSLVAKTIFSNVGRLYPEFQKLNQTRASRDNESFSTVSSASQQPSASKPASKPNEQRRAYDPFAARLEIMSYTNPLRAKIVLFSTLYHSFDYSNQDWLNLRAHELDDLLQSLFRACKSFAELESHLHNTARRLKEPGENTKAAKAILQALKPFYTLAQVGVNQAQTLGSNNNDEMITALNMNEPNSLNQTSVEYDDNDYTCQFLPS